MTAWRSPALEVRGAWKAYDDQPVLRGVDLSIAPGEIHALLGANGAGKSTLIKIISGIVARDAGDVVIAGREMPRRYLAGDAVAAGLSVVHQDVGLVDDLSVVDNIALRLGYLRTAGIISYRRTRAIARRALASVGSDLDVDASVASLSQAQRVMVALGCVMATSARVLILDEVSASVPAPDVTRIAGMLRKMRDEGVGVVFVTHRLAEVFSLADRVTVLRDGLRIGTAAVDDLDEPRLVGWIAGRSVQRVRPRSSPGVGDGVRRLSVTRLACAGIAAPVSFEVASGEILALTGLVGSGAHAVTKALGGAAPVAEGEVRVDGHAIPSRRPDRLMAHGCAYLPADRQRTGIAPLLSVRENLFLVRNRRAGDTFLRRPRRERARAVELVDRVRVKVAAATSQQAVEAPISTLSGGNQQKVLVGRAVRGAPRVLILEDPTAGVDVGARADLLLLLLGLADAGTAILLASVDYDEIGQVADRAIVFADGRVVADLSRGRITEEELARASFGYAPEVEDHRAHAQ